MLHLPLVDGSFDYVVAIRGDGYIYDFLGFPAQCRRVLGEGDLLIFQAINRHN